MIFALCGCGDSGSADTSSAKTSSKKTSSGKINSFTTARTYKETEGPKWNFDNTYYKLTKEKKLNVAYIGGSVTVGTGGDPKKDCWRVYTTNWFKENFPNAEINEIDASIGATSSLWGFARYKREVIEKNPDIIFIEFSVNDVYTGLAKGTSAAIMDGMIRETQKALPNCDIVVISVPDSSSFNGVSGSRDAHAGAAKYNGVTWLDMSVPLKAIMQKKGTAWGDYITDSVHPNKTGYRVYADYIAETLTAEFKQSKARGASKLVAHTVPAEAYTSNPASNAQTIWSPDIKYGDGWKLGGSIKKMYFAQSSYTALRGNNGATLTFEVKGCYFAVFGDFKQNSKVRFQLDGGNDMLIGYNKDQSGEQLIYDNMDPNVTHTITLTVEGSGLCGLICVFIG